MIQCVHAISVNVAKYKLLFLLMSLRASGYSMDDGVGVGLEGGK